MELREALAVLAALDRHDVDYVLVGGLALGIHGLVRATRDIDLFVRPTTDNIERLRAALRSVFDDVSIDEIMAADLAGGFPAFAMVRPTLTSSSTSSAGLATRSRSTTSRASDARWMV